LAALDAGKLPAKPILRALAMMHHSEVVDGLITRLGGASGEGRQQILAALCRLHYQEGKWKGDSWGTRPDTRGPYYQPETWSETARIADVLKKSLQQATPGDAAALIQTMHRNRIESDDALARMLRLAETNDRLLDPAVAQLAASRVVPAQAMTVLSKAAVSENASPKLLSNAVVCLTKIKDSLAPATMLTALSRLDNCQDAGRDQNVARNAFVNASALDAFVPEFAQAAANPESGEAFWAEVALLAIASKKNASPESRALAGQTIETAWQNDKRRGRLMLAAAKINNHSLDDRIWQARNDPDDSLANIAKAVIKQLKIKPAAVDDSPKIGSLSISDATAAVLKRSGDAAFGQRVFTKANCAACHTVRADEPQKGPFLGNIAKTYKRPELAAAILEPNKTIAQGFTTNSILTVDGKVLTGFVTNELSDRVTIRDQQGKELTISKDEIEVRKTMKTSVMPTGLMNEYTTHEVASLLDYLQSLAP
jgi:putative heme-binding domain-containing protein